MLSCREATTAVVGPYKTVLCARSLLAHTDADVMTDNEALYVIRRRNVDSECPSDTNINRLLAQIISSVSTSPRFDPGLNVDVTEFEMNVVPYPRLHSMLCSYHRSFVSTAKAYHEHLFVAKGGTRSLFIPAKADFLISLADQAREVALDTKVALHEQERHGG